MGEADYVSKYIFPIVNHRLKRVLNCLAYAEKTRIFRLTERRLERRD